MLESNVDHGRVVATCRFGQADPNTTHAVCDVDWVPNATNNGCQPRPPRNCSNGQAHGTSVTKDICIAGVRGYQTTTCNDGRLSYDSRRRTPAMRCPSIEDNRL